MFFDYNNMRNESSEKIQLRTIKFENGKVVVTVDNNGKLQKDQEVFVVTPSKNKRNLIKKQIDVLVRARVEEVKDNSVILSSVPRGRTTLNAAKTSIEQCINSSNGVFIKGIEKW